MDCRVKPCNDGSWAKYRSIHALYSPTRSHSLPIIPWLDHGIHADALGPDRSPGWHGQGVVCWGQALERPQSGEV
ncbi:hypothetical protein ACSSV1_000346 [Labrenzia sp. MBR-25]